MLPIKDRLVQSEGSHIKGYRDFNIFNGHNEMIKLKNSYVDAVFCSPWSSPRT